MSKYILPSNKIPKAFNQNIIEPLRTDVGSCVACTFTKILEVMVFNEIGIYVDLSKGYVYGRNNMPNKKKPGMVEEYTLDIMLNRGTVPLSMCSDYTELPELTKILESRPDIAELDKEAEKIRFKSWTNISGNNSKQRFENIKEYLQKYEMPLAGTLKNYEGEKHSVVIVGFDDDGYIYFHNHKGRDDFERVKYDGFSKAFYLEGEINLPKMSFTDVKESDWFYEYVKRAYNEGIINGTSADTFSPNKSLTRAEMSAIVCRILDKVGVK